LYAVGTVESVYENVKMGIKGTVITEFGEDLNLDFILDKWFFRRRTDKGTNWL